MKKRVSVGRPGAANEDYQGRDERRRAAEREREELAKRAEYNQPDVKANRIKANAAMRRKLHAGFKQTVDPAQRVAIEAEIDRHFAAEP
jgi:hypothetical protein